MPGIAVSGRIVWDGKPSLDRDELLVSISPADSRISFNGPARVVGSSFVLRDVFEGTYRLAVSGQSKDCYIKSLRYGSNDALESGFTVVRGAQSSLEVSISSQGARVQGAVMDQDKLPVTDCGLFSCRMKPTGINRVSTRKSPRINTDAIF